MGQRHPVYERIAEEILRRVACGELRPGDRLPPVREAATVWGVNLNTAARAYALLVQRGVLETRSGGGTVVARPGTSEYAEGAPVDRARSERLRARIATLVLEALGQGYTEAELEAAFGAQLARWSSARAASEAPPEPERAPVAHALRCNGSHDLALDLLASRLRFRASAQPGAPVLEVTTSTSLDGLAALARGECDVAGSHLYDRAESDYNVSYARTLLPARRVTLVTLAERVQGLIVAAGNPLNFASTADLARPGVRFVNRPVGSGTRSLLDDLLERAGIEPAHVQGYETEEASHLAVAAAVASGTADVGLGILAAARAFDLSFVPIVRERFELVFPTELLDRGDVRQLLAEIRSQEYRAAVDALGGYDTSQSGHLRSVA